jgi:hypothetical protein
MRRVSLILVVGALAVSGCGGGGSDGRAAAKTGGGTTAPGKTCPVTLPNGQGPPTERASSDNHGNGDLWTGLWPHNVVIADPRFVEKDGSVGMKWPFWRGTRGKLTVSGRRLDEPADPLRAEIPDGYGLSGFQPSGLRFPTDGCREVTARSGTGRLTFVTLVVEAPYLTGREQQK